MINYILMFLDGETIEVPKRYFTLFDNGGIWFKPEILRLMADLKHLFNKYKEYNEKFNKLEEISAKDNQTIADTPAPQISVTFKSITDKLPSFIQFFRSE